MSQSSKRKAIRRPRYPQNATDPDVIAAFDTDRTVNIGAGGRTGPVPLSHVVDLRNDEDVSVWATGFNQRLRDKAKIPGMAELKDITDDSRRFVERDDRMRLLDQVFPAVEAKFVVDDVDLSNLENEGWTYHTPWGYAHDVLGYYHVDADRDARSLFRRDDQSRIGEWL